MKLIAFVFSLLSLASLIPADALAQAPKLVPEWAYPWAFPRSPRPVTVEPDPDQILQIPDSRATYTYAQSKNFFGTLDWHPEDHPDIPDIVRNGNKPHVFACGFCHRADGIGGPENASLNGLPAAYIVQQLAAFKSGARKATISSPGSARPIGMSYMAEIATFATAAEIDSAAAYFSSIKPKASIDVIETDLVPQTYLVGTLYADTLTGAKEPIGNRIVEIPHDLKQFESRDARSRFVAYVPVGSIKKGEWLVSGGDAGKTVRCATCHGAGLKGVGLIPRLAGRSPSYIARQLYDIQQGTRATEASAPMRAVVEKLNAEDMMFIATYVASLSP